MKPELSDLQNLLSFSVYNDLTNSSRAQLLDNCRIMYHNGLDYEAYLKDFKDVLRAEIELTSIGLYDEAFDLRMKEEDRLRQLHYEPVARLLPETVLSVNIVNVGTGTMNEKRSFQMWWSKRKTLA